MAVRESVSPNGAGTRRAWFVATCLLVLFVAALFLRAYWNLDAANPSEGEFILSGGSDPYYHKHAVDQIQASGFRHHLNDPLLNYPIGSENPNPPLYQWAIAVAGKFMEPFFDGGLEESTWMATLWSPTIFGALTLIPIYFIGAALFDRRAGLIAALLWTVSTSAVDSGGLGLADHDAAVLFFVSLSFLFYLQAIRHFRGDANWVTRWNDGGSVSSGLGALFRARGTGFAYALLAAVSIAAVALTWKGFNYVIGIVFLYAIIQMVVDHWRSKDSTGLFLATLVAIGGGVILALPYYLTANVGNFLQPTWFILAAFVAAGVVLVPTRDLPTILVMPAALILGIILAIASFFVFPDVARSLLYATVYFKQTRLYETIAEAHPADFSTIMFGIGPVAFFLAIGGWVWLAFTIKRHPGRPILFALLWGAVAVFMAQSAVRFLINAIPIFCVFAGFGAVAVLDWLDFGAIRKSLAANRGNAWAGVRRGTRPMHIVGALLIALLFVFPTTILAADAAMPAEAENRLARESDSPFVQNFYNERLGAYGQGFGQVVPWIGPLEWLKEHDANITNPADRPAFLSWWDYGHWAIAIGQHPAVADNFQNGYEFAANFILSQDEAASLQLLAARLAEAPGSDLQAALQQVGSADPATDAKSIRAWEKVDLTIAQSSDLVNILEDQTGKSIRYFATDIRMLPYDNPQTQNIEAGSIFYAPVTLKGDEPNDYVTTQVNIGQAVPGAPDGYVTIEQYETLARDPIRQYQVLGERYVYRPSFTNSAYWRHYVGTPVTPQDPQMILGTDIERSVNNPLPGYGLEHFRAVYIGNITRLYRGGDPADFQSFLYYPEVVITEYFPGAIVEGTVTEGGNPVANAVVTAFDDTGRLLARHFGEGINAADFNVPHAQVTTDANGKYRIVAPFALEGGAVTLVAQRENVRLGSTELAITREDANAERVFSDVEITVERGSVTGTVFRDANADGRYDAANETAESGVTVTIAGRNATTGADGAYSIADVPAGTHDVTVDSANLTVASAAGRVAVRPNEATTHNVPLTIKRATIGGTLVADIDGDGNISELEGVRVTNMTFTADPNVADNTAVTQSGVATQEGGNFTLDLVPGSYVVNATYTHAATGDTFTLAETLVVAPGDTRTGLQLVMTKQ